MRASEVYGGQYLKAADILGRQVTVTINNIGMAELGEPPKNKLVIFFEGKEKGMALNATNANILADALGDETDNWIGAKVVVSTAKTRFGNKIVDGLVLRLVGNGHAKPVQRVPSGPSYDGDDPRTQARAAPADDLSDEVPF